MSRVLPAVCSAALLALLSACGNDTVTQPDTNSAVTGIFHLAWTTTLDAPTITVLAGLTMRTDDCGNGDDAPNASFAFDTSSVLAMQETPQAYSLTLSGETVACDGTRSPFFDVISGDYLLVDNSRVTLQGDVTHPHLVGEIVSNDEAGTVEIQLRAGQPGLADPARGIDVLCFARPAP